MSFKAVFRCEACNERLVKRTSFLAHKFLRQDAWVCPNPMCGAAYTGHSELTAIASPSGMDNADSELPLTPAAHRARFLQAHREAQDERQLDLLSAGGEPAITT